MSDYSETEDFCKHLNDLSKAYQQDGQMQIARDLTIAISMIMGLEEQVLFYKNSEKIWDEKFDRLIPKRKPAEKSKGA